MSDFNLLGFLNISVPNEPLTPITPRKENFKILTPSSKPDEHAASSTPKAKKTPERLLERATSSDSTSPKGKQSPYFRTTYGQAFGTGSKPPSPTDDAPSTPTSVSSVSSVSSTISVCEDPECDDCLTRKEQDAKKALAAHEREMEKSAFENANRKIEEEIANERKKEAEKRDKEKRELEEDRERIRAEKAALQAEKQKEDADDAAMLKELSKVNQDAILAANARNREYRGELQAQMEDDRARRIEEEELNRNQPSSAIGFGADQDARQAAREAAQKDILRALEQQKADRKASGKAEQEAELEELRRRRAEEEAIYQANKAAKEEKDRKAKAEILSSNKDASAEKRARLGEEAANERAFTLGQQEQSRLQAEEEKRKADEKKRAELEALHRQLADQVQRRREALRQQKEDDKLFGPKETVKAKKTLIHCVDCEQDLPAERFSNFVVTPNGKVYKRSKAEPKSSPLHKYLCKQGAAAYDFY